MAAIIKFTNPGGLVPTIDFMATPATYRITHWEPGVAVRRSEGEGGPAYEDVDEEMTISIINPTPSLATSIYLHPLQRLFDRAMNWARGDLITPIILHYKAHSSSEEVQAVVKGPIAPGAPVIELPPGHTISEATGNIDGVKLRFKRSGLWLGDTQTASGTSGANPTVQTITWSATPPGGISPYLLRLNNLPFQGGMQGSFVLVGQGMSIIHAESAAGGSGFTSQSDPTKHALNGNVLRYTPSGTSSQTRIFTGGGPWASEDFLGNTFAVFFNYRNNSATTSFRVRFSHPAYFYSATNETIIPGGLNDPMWTYGGMLTVPTEELGQLAVTIQASAASGSLDIDSVAVLNMSTPDARAIRVTLLSSAGGLNQNVVIDHRSLTRTMPSVFWGSEGSPYGYTGDIHLYTPYPRIRAMWLAAHDGFWRAVTATPNPVSFQFTGILQKGYTVP